MEKTHFKWKNIPKRVIFYIVMYLSVAALSIIFLTTSFIMENEKLQELTALLLILWIPLIFFTILTHLPQSIAGNLFMYTKIRNTKKREYKFLTYSSTAFAQTEMFYQLLTEPIPMRIKKVKVDRSIKKQTGADGKQYFTVVLRDLRTYRVTMTRRDKRIESRYTTDWVIANIQQTGGYLKKQRTPKKMQR